MTAEPSLETMEVRTQWHDLQVKENSILPTFICSEREHLSKVKIVAMHCLFLISNSTNNGSGEFRTRHGKALILRGVV